MKIKDFKLTKKVSKDIQSKKTETFCECCLRVNPNMNDGYTTCCNELSVDKSEALEIAKSQDIFDYLSLKFKCSSSNGMNRHYTIFSLDTKKVKFEINLRNSEEDIIKKVIENTKGLRKDK